MEAMLRSMGHEGNITDPKGRRILFEDMRSQSSVGRQGRDRVKLVAGQIISSTGLPQPRRALSLDELRRTIKLGTCLRAELRTLAGHAGSIAAIDFSPDGRFVVSAAKTAARGGDTQTGELLATL